MNWLNTFPSAYLLLLSIKTPTHPQVSFKSKKINKKTHSRNNSCKRVHFCRYATLSYLFRSLARSFSLSLSTLLLRVHAICCSHTKHTPNLDNCVQIGDDVVERKREILR